MTGCAERLTLGRTPWRLKPALLILGKTTLNFKNKINANPAVFCNLFDCEFAAF